MVHACAFDSVPADMGVMFVSKVGPSPDQCRPRVLPFAWHRKGLCSAALMAHDAQLFQKPSVCTSVESFLSIDTGVCMEKRRGLGVFDVMTTDANIACQPPGSGGKGFHGHLTTFEAAVHGFGAVRDLMRVRRDIARKYRYDDKRSGPPLKAKAGPYFDHRVGR